MSLLEAIGLGALQGITEFLPVSSSGHLVVARLVLEIEGMPIIFDILLHVATLLAVVLVFRNRLFALSLSTLKFLFRRAQPSDKENLRIVVIILLATLCTAIIGFALSFLDLGRYPKVVFALFIVTGLVLLFTKTVKGSQDLSSLSVRHGFVAGIAQGLGVLPGISRSGITIAGALYTGLSRETAGEFSFLLSIPAILGALILKVGDIGDLGTQMGVGVLLMGMLASFAIGLLSLLVLLKIIKKGRIYLFSVYLIPLGVVGLILQFSN